MRSELGNLGRHCGHPHLTVAPLRTQRVLRMVHTGRGRLWNMTAGSRCEPLDAMRLAVGPEPLHTSKSQKLSLPARSTLYPLLWWASGRSPRRPSSVCISSCSLHWHWAWGWASDSDPRGWGHKRGKKLGKKVIFAFTTSHLF